MQNITTKFLKLNVVIMTLALLTSCATSMTPMQVNNTLPTLTKSKFISQAQAEEAVKSNGCKYLVKGRNYTAPIGLTTKDDLRNGAKGIDEWVKLDGGNAYVLNNYKWVTVDHNGSTQLHIEFDTMLCE
ncbi:hypothetical protein [Sphingobacterium sp. BN32]|uniref:hypothetical protein n=1 Tax=Sphingobacterium sp. BN32 TaxID=3058432 RepID=UPI00265CC3A0|nr:hypothetical protein [Sphingobacterium sp. BN32]WKK59305.1 hypothetical protein QYC40_03535 [Sphingobacterium sp. BN32]